ncbi:hypothetical protein GWI33_008016, partial [Rhynchophorus ferrugineus]
CWECFLHIFMSIKNGPYVNITDDIVGVTGVANCFYYGAVFQYSNKRWSKFFSDLTDTVQFGTPPGMDKIAKENNRFSMMFGYFCISGCLLYSAISLIDTALTKIKRDVRVVASPHRNELKENPTPSSDIIVGKIGTPVLSVPYKFSIFASVIRGPVIIT